MRTSADRPDHRGIVGEIGGAEMGREFATVLAWIVGPKVDPYLGPVALIAVIVVGIPVILAMRREAREQPVSDEDLLSQFEEAHAAGDMDDAEFRRVCALLKGRLGRKWIGEKDGPASSSAPPPSPPGRLGEGEAPTTVEPERP